mmetsp:Transcript_32270/g.43697  ORF Transcript_32270/g.43697 Transcript_32270/m.43697 type:complete len:133 (-) Transcript_32270:613-1011(-)
MRHGKGSYSLQDGTKYEGMWIEDRKQGNGELLMSSGEIIKCTWDNDRINGEGTLKDTKGNVIEAIWNYDMMILKGNQGGIDLIPMQIFLLLSTITFIILGIIVDINYIFGIIPCWMFNIIESFCCSKTLKYV